MTIGPYFHSTYSQVPLGQIDNGEDMRCVEGIASGETIYGGQRFAVSLSSEAGIHQAVNYGVSIFETLNSKTPKTSLSKIKLGAEFVIIYSNFNAVRHTYPTSSNRKFSASDPFGGTNFKLVFIVFRWVFRGEKLSKFKYASC